MEKLKPCPCGQIPKSIAYVDAPSGSRWARCAGECCMEWWIEFPATPPIEDEDAYEKLAIKYWNAAPRG